METHNQKEIKYPSKHIWVLQTFERKCLAKAKKRWVQKPLIIECFKNVLCFPFSKHLMLNVRKTLQMNIIMSE